MIADSIIGQVTMHDALRVAGLGAPNAHGYISCPFHGHDENPSCHLVGPKGAETGYRCFSCDAHGGILDFLVRLGIANDNADAAERLGSPRVNATRRVVASFTYCDEQGEPVGCVERVEPGKNGRDKDFAQYRREDGRFIPGLAGRILPLYHRDEVAICAAEMGTLFFTEGEGKGDRLRAVLRSANSKAAVTTVAGGIKAVLREEHLSALAGVSAVIVLADSDEPGRVGAQLRASQILHLHPDTDVRVVDMFPSKTDGSDVGDWLEDHTLAELRALVSAAARFTVPVQTVFVTDAVRAGDAVDPWEKDERRYSLGLSNVDRRLGPLRPAGLTIIAALPGYGKTSLAEQMACANARLQKRVFFATLEMTEPEIQANLVGREMGISLLEFERERKANSQEYRDAVDRVRSLDLTLYRPPVGEEPDIQTIFGRAMDAKADLLFVDYTKYLKGWQPGNEAAKIVMWTAAQAKHTGLHVVLLAQLKAESLGKRPTMEHMEDTRRLNQDCTTLLFIHRPFAGHKTKDTIAEIIAAKNRKGMPFFRGHTHWNGPTHTFYSMDEAEEAQAECCKPRKKADKTTEPIPERAETEMTKAEEDALLSELPFSQP